MHNSEGKDWVWDACLLISVTTIHETNGTQPYKVAQKDSKIFKLSRDLIS